MKLMRKNNKTRQRFTKGKENGRMSILSAKKIGPTMWTTEVVVGSVVAVTKSLNRQSINQLAQGSEDVDKETGKSDPQIQARSD